MDTEMETEGTEDCAVLERIFLSVVLTESDEQFEECLRKFLPHILKKSGSPFPEVNRKVVEVLSHISKRVKAAKNVQLPIQTLIELYSNPNASSFIINFTIIYIKMGFPRLPLEEKQKLLPKILEITQNRPLLHQESLCILFLTSLKNYPYPRDNQERLNIFNIKNLTVKKTLLDIIMDIMLFPYGCTSESNLTDISVESFKRLTRDDLIELNSDYFEKFKISVIQLLGILGSTDVFSHLVVASSDARSTVAESAESQLKLLPDINYDDLTIVTPLYSLFLKVGTKGSNVSSLNPRTRLKLLQNMAKFRAIVWPAAIKVLFESLYGGFTNQKIKNHALIFMSSIIRNLQQDKLEQIYSVLLNAGIMKLLKEDTDRKNKIQAFQILPTLILKCPEVAKKDISCIEFIFSSIENQDDPDLRSAARDAAYSMAKGFNGISPDQEKILYSLLTTKLFPLTGIRSGTGAQLEGMRSARSAAVRFVTEACSQTPLKVFTLLKSAVLGDDDSCSEAKKALYLNPDLNKNYKPISFIELLTLVLSEDKIKPLDHSVLKEIVNYLRLCLAKEISPGAKSCIAHPSEESVLVHNKLSEYNTDPEILPAYLNILIKNIQAEPNDTCLSAVLELVGCLPVLANVDKLQMFIDLAITHTKEDVRLLSAEIASLIVPSDASLKTTKTCLNNIINGGKDVEKIHGSIALFGYVIGRHGGATKESVEIISNHLSQTTYQSIAVLCLGHMSQTYPLPLSTDTWEKLVKTLLDILLDQKTVPKLKEKICMTLCNFCVVEMDFPFKDTIINKFIDSARQIKDVDQCMSMSEAFCCAVLGKASVMSLNPWRRDPDSIKALNEKISKGQIETVKATENLEYVLNKILKNLYSDRHPQTRQSYCFWLLGLVKQCSFFPVIEKWLTDLQNGFIDLLSDTNDIVQEGAAKGLAFVYEATQDNELKSALLKSVIEQVTLGRRSVVKVSDDTKLFQPDELGETPTGGKLSTYKELCQLASDLNQPDLIYKFMQLANHNSVWNSKKGAAYTITSLISKAGDEMNEHLPRVLVKLYRYQFDPMPNIQRSMSDVWSSLASHDTVEKYYFEIFNDLLENITNPAWRVRISCCAAVQDFMRGTGGNKIIQHPVQIGQLWEQILRVMDDIHEGTRNSAVSTGKHLSKICIRESKGKSGKALAVVVLDILLKKGLKSSVTEIRTLSVATVSEMVKEGLPKEYAPDVIVSLLKSCADIDLANLYVAGNTAAETLDKIRIPLLKSKDVVQALVSCLPHINVEIIEKIHNDLVDLLKNSAGFGTRIVTSHFLVLMSHHMTKEEFQPLVGKFLGALLSGLSDKSPGIRRQFASSIGQILRYAKDSSVERLLEKLSGLYFDKEDDGIKKSICYTLQAISMHSQDCVKDKEDLILPLVFFAKHIQALPDGSNKTDIEDWNEVWNDLAYTNNVLISNQENVVALLKTASQSPSWKIKVQMASAAKTLGNREISQEKRLELTKILLGSLPGRTWEGKENILHALSALAKEPKSILESGTDQELIESIMKECKKEREDYKIHTFIVLGEIVESLDIDIFPSVYPMLKDVLTRGTKSDDNGDQVNKEHHDSRLKLLEITYEALGKSWPRNKITQSKYIDEVLNHLKNSLELSTPQIQVKILASISLIITKTRCFLREESPLIRKIVDSLIQTMEFCFSIPKNTKLKKEALNLLQSLQITFRGRNETEYVRLSEFFNKFSPSLAKESAPELKSRFADIIEMFRTETLMS